MQSHTNFGEAEPAHAMILLEVLRRIRIVRAMPSDSPQLFGPSHIRGIRRIVEARTSLLLSPVAQSNALL